MDEELKKRIREAPASIEAVIKLVMRLEVEIKDLIIGLDERIIKIEEINQVGKTKR